MSVKPITIGEPRPLRDAEAALITSLLKAKHETIPLLAGLKYALVQDMNDGGMGSLRFVGEESRRFGSAPVKATFADSDGVPVSVALFLDRSGSLYELDVFKADGSKLTSLPDADKIKISN